MSTDVKSLGPLGVPQPLSELQARLAQNVLNDIAQVGPAVVQLGCFTVVLGLDESDCYIQHTRVVNY